jgi:hypothetical protein
MRQRERVGSRGGRSGEWDQGREWNRERDAVGEREDSIDGGPEPEEQVQLWVVDRWLEVRFSVARTDFRRGRDGPAVPVEQGWPWSELRTPEMRWLGSRGGDRESEIGGESETERDAVGERKRDDEREREMNRERIRSPEEQEATSGYGSSLSEREREMLRERERETNREDIGGESETERDDVGERKRDVERERDEQREDWLVAGELTSGKAGTVRQELCRLNSNWRLWSWFEKWWFCLCVFCIFSFGVICWCVCFLLDGIKDLVSAKSWLKLFPLYYMHLHKWMYCK